MKKKFLFYIFQKNLLIKCLKKVSEKDKSHYVFIKDLTD